MQDSIPNLESSARYPSAKDSKAYLDAEYTPKNGVVTLPNTT
ncbi:MAG: hypothetical protein R2788_14605 [Saprospiraceae bacterium]